MSHLETLRAIVANSHDVSRFTIDTDLRGEAGMDGNLAVLLQAARMLDEHAEDTATLALEERARVVAWLRAEAFLSLYEATPNDVADALARGIAVIGSDD
jgi:hypothetical protein